MEKGDKPKMKRSTKKSGLKTKEKKPTKQKQKQKQKQENVQIVKVNVNTGKEEKPALMKPIRKEITKQTTYVTLDKPYALQPEEEELLTITKHIPNPPRDKSRAKVTTLVSDPKNEIPQPNIQDQPISIPVPIKKKATVKPKGLFDVPIEIYVGAKPIKEKPPKAKTTEEEQPLLSAAEEVITKIRELRRKRREKPIVTNSSTIDKSIQNSSINNNEKVQELVLAEPTTLKMPIEQEKGDIYDYSKNTDDANISNANSGEKINIQNETELEEELGLSSAELLSYKEDYVMTPKGSVEGIFDKIDTIFESIDISKRGRPIKYNSEEERIQAIKEQKKASALRKKEETKLMKKIETEIEYEKFIQGDYPPDSLEEMLSKDLIQKKQNEQAFASAMVNEAYSASISGQDLSKVTFDPFVGQDIIVSPQIYLSTTKDEPELSSDFVSSLVDKLSDNNNYKSNQSAQEQQFEFL